MGRRFRFVWAGVSSPCNEWVRATVRENRLAERLPIVDSEGCTAIFSLASSHLQIFSP